MKKAIPYFADNKLQAAHLHGISRGYLLFHKLFAEIALVSRPDSSYTSSRRIY